MAWRPHANLIDGALDNRVSGKVTGWICFFRQGKEPLQVTLDLSGDFHEDIRGKVIRFSNPVPTDPDSDETDGDFLEGFAAVQHGEAGDITAGRSLGPWTPDLAQTLMAQYERAWDKRSVPESTRQTERARLAEDFHERIEDGELFYPYVPYPYIEWFSDSNGRVVLELEPSQVEVIESAQMVEPKTAAELADDEEKRNNAMQTFVSDMRRRFSGDAGEG